MEQKKVKRGDFIIMLSAGVVATGLFTWNWLTNRANKQTQVGNNSLIARVERHGEVIAEIDINNITEKQYINFDDRVKITIEVEPGRIRFLESECPDQICVHTGWLTQQGQLAVCMPGRTVVSL